MKRYNISWLDICLVVLMILAGTISASAVEYIHPKKDVASGSCTVSADGVIYHNMDYPKAPPTYYGGWVTFTPENPGDPLFIKFTEFSCLRGGNPVVFLYDDEEILKANFTSYSKPVPAGYIAAIRPEDVDKEYTSASGKLCVLYAPASKSDFVTSSPSGSIAGTYTAEVTAGVPREMIFESAVYSPAETLYRGASDITLADLQLTTDGSLNPLQLVNLEFDASATISSGMVKNLRLYFKEISSDNLLAAVADGAEMLAVTNRNLAGNDRFLLVADLEPDAVGALPLPVLRHLTIGDADRNVQTSQTSVDIPNEIRMPGNDTAKTFTIYGDTDFYDAGGADGVIPLYTTGTAVFLPAAAGERVAIDFTRLALFNTSSTGLNDLLQVYNGSEATPDNLIAELLDNPQTIKSSAEDGALTVKFTSRQGNLSQCKPGWEAVVSTFTPSDMILQSVEGEDVAPLQAYPGEENVELMTLVLTSDNQLNPLIATELMLSTPAGCDISAIEKIELLYQSSLPGAHPEVISSASAESGKFTFTFGQPLAEGANRFILRATLKESARSNSKFGIRFDKITVGGEDHTPEGDIETSVEVVAHCALEQGAHIHNIYDDWSFTAANGTEGNYPAVNADHTVTFIPTREGAVAQLKFESFNVYFSSSSWSTRATFEVYSGTRCDAENLIWKLSSADESTTGPGRALRSSSPDGALTIRFNPNASSSYYTSGGWNATVSQFTDHAAEIISAETVQSSTAIVGPATADAELIECTLETEGTLTPLDLSGALLTLKGAREMSAVNFRAGADKENLPVVATLPIDTSSDEATEVTLTLDTPITLPEGFSYLKITADIKEAITGEVELDAALNSLVFSDGSTYTVTNGNPDGFRVSKNIHIFRPDKEYTVTVDKPLMIYDDGGPDGRATALAETTVTFVPARSGEVLLLDTEEFSIGAGRLHVYSGRTADEANLLGKSYYYTMNGPEKLISKADDGSMTIHYKAASASTLDGFAMSLTPLKAQPMTITDMSLDPAADIPVLRGCEGEPIAKLTLKVEGTSGKILLEGVKADFSASTSVRDILSARLYYTAANGAFSPMATVTSSVTPSLSGEAMLTFDTPVEIDEAGEYFLWIAADIAPAAVPRNRAAVAVSSVMANGAETVPGEPLQTSREIVSGMGGTYRIGASPDADYSTIASAVKALDLGVEDAVIFMIESGEYHENLEISNVKGSTAEHPVIFTSQTGNRDDVVISGATLLEKQGMIKVENSSYIHFRNITIYPNTTGYYAALQLKDGCRGCSVENCVIKSDEVTGVSSGISLVRTEDGGEENTNCDWFRITGSRLENGFIALYLGGTSYVDRPKVTGMEIADNEIVNAYSKGIYLSDCLDFTVRNNSVTTGANARKSYQAMDVYRPHGSFVISGNRIVNNASVDSYGIYLRQGGGSDDPEAPALVVNNSVAIPQAVTSYTYGMMVDASATNILLAHNSINIGGAATLASVYGLAFSGNAPAEGAMRIANNIIVNMTKGGALRPWNNTHYANLIFASNVYYGNSGIVDTDGKTLAQYAEATGDETSVWAEPQFFNPSDLHLREPLAMVAGLPEVTTDADGNDRGSRAMPGAYEYREVVTGAPQLAEGYPVAALVKDTSATIKTLWSIGGRLYGIARKATEEAPSREQLLNSRPVIYEADREASYTFSFLEQLTPYKAYFLAVSALGEESEICDSPEFVTAETFLPLEVAFDWDGEPVGYGESALILADIIGGKQPYTCRWYDQMNNLIGEDEYIAPDITVNTMLRLVVTSADGQEAQGKVEVYCASSETAIADFEDNYIPEQGFRKWDEAFARQSDRDRFFSGSFRFPNYPNYYYGSWSGYAFANHTETSFETVADHQFRNVSGGGAGGSASYGVVYFGNADMRIQAGNGTGHAKVAGVYVNNSAYTLSAILNGAGNCRKFSAENGDWMSLYITGEDADGNVTATVEVPLADYRAATAAGMRSASAPYLLTSWQWVDLSSLGDVKHINLSYDSSQRAHVPAYVCIDRLGAKGETVSTSLPAADADRLTLRIVAPDVIEVADRAGSDLSGCTVEIRNVAGLLVARVTGERIISLAALEPGIYIATATSADGRASLRFRKH